MTNYSKKLGLGESLLMVIPALALLWALASGHGPRFVLIALGAGLLYVAFKFLRLIWLAYFK